MCIFSGKIEEVSSTSIFCSDLGNNKRCTIYQMNVNTKRDVAMVLPVPTQKEIEFVDFSDYDNFFEDLDRLFPKPVTRSSSRSVMKGGGLEPLAVHSVGSFVASFVPSLDDFDRLDKRFKIGEDLWDELPNYEAFGFAVFKLKPGNQKVHPMAYKYVTNAPMMIYFPTSHVHDGRVPLVDRFDHNLYFQLGFRFGNCEKWRTGKSKDGAGAVQEFVDINKCQGLVRVNREIQKRSIHESHRNGDFYLAWEKDDSLTREKFMPIRKRPPIAMA